MSQAGIARSGGGNTGNVMGPGSSTNRAIATFNGITGTILYDNPTTNISASGAFTNTAQPTFSAYLTNTASNVTGDVTFYTIPFDTTLSNVGSSYNPTTGLFTVPVTGNYLITYGCFATTTSTYTDCINFISINGSNLYKNEGNKQQTNTTYNGTFSIVLPLTLGQTIGIVINSSTAANTKNTSVTGDATNRLNNFSMMLLS